ncbi:MAG: hydrogenase large subunit [Candidatus Asgardarchaeia archaeon]
MSEYTIPIGPIHPSLKEPMMFKFIVENEIVVDVIMKISYNHRGIEKAAEGRTWLQDVYLLERICGICSHAHTTAFTNAVEKLLGVEIPPRAEYIRTLVAELERLHSHSLWLGITTHLAGWDTLFMYIWRDREVVMNILETVSGNRVNYGINTIGGVRRDLTEEAIKKIRKGMDLLEKRVKYYREICSKEETLLKRVVGVGVLKPEVGKELGAVGPTIRASGIPTDVRKDDPYNAYDELPFNVITNDMCDVAGRIFVRIDEMLESINMIRWLLDHLPDGPISLKVKPIVPEGEVVSRVEAPRGEDIHYVRSYGDARSRQKPFRVKVRAPTLANWLATREMLKGRYIADIPIVIGGIDPCISCTSRVAFVDITHSKPKSWIWTDEELRIYGIKWYQNKMWRK